MRRIIVTLLLIFSMSPALTYSQSITPDAGTSWGPGLSKLRIEGDPDEHGLVWMINEPERAFESWYVVVYNSSNQPVFDVQATLEYQKNGQWYLPNTSASRRYLYPTKIDPGGIGYLEFGSIGASESPWTDARVIVDSIQTEFTLGLTPISVDDVSVSGTKYSGTFTNDSNYPVTDPTVIVGCVKDGEIISIDTEQSDLLKLAPGKEEHFTLDANDPCSPDGVVVTSVALIVK